MKTIDISGINTSSRLKPGTIGSTDSIHKILHSEITFLERKFGNKEKESFYHELGLLIGTGVDIKTAFDILTEDILNKKHKSLMQLISAAIIQGVAFHEVLGLHPGTFTNYEIQSIKIGEDSGQLPQVLKELGDYYESAVKLKRQIIGILTYPIVVICMALLVVYFMLSVVVPIFSDIFSQTGAELPEITRFLIRLSNNSGFYFTTVAIITLLFFVFHSMQKKKSWYRLASSRLILKPPVIGQMVQKIYLARFCQAMKLLSAAKVRINESLYLVKDMIAYYPIEQALEHVNKDIVEGGKLLHESLEKHTIFPKKLIALIKLSEEVNAPELIYDKLHKQYSIEIEHKQALLGKLIEPLFIIILGLFVGFILVAMYLPMFEISTGSF